MSMRVLQVIDKLNVGGAEKVFIDMVNILATSGQVDVEVLLFFGGGTLDEKLNEQVKKNILGRKHKFSVATMWRASKICKEFDIIHVHMRHCYAYIRMVQWIFGGRYKIILHDHYGDIGINKRVPLKLKYIFTPVNYIGVSKALKDWAKANFKRSRTFLLRNIVVLQKGVEYAPVQTGRALVVANIRKTKNIEFAIQLCGMLGLSLDVYGNRQDNEYWLRISSLAENAGTTINIIEGVTDVTPFYGRYTLALHTAVSETGPLVLLEYMACGLPFVAYNTGEVALAISPLLPECFVNTFNVQDWKAAIEKVTMAADLPYRLRSIFNDLYSTEQYRNECLEIYRSVNC